jgi:drug/metabolite transporter (DMT)-like permease
MTIEAQTSGAAAVDEPRGPAMVRAKPVYRSNLLGIVAVVGAGLAMMSSDACMRGAIKEIPLGEAIAGRGALACVLLLIAAMLYGALRWHAGLLSPPMCLRIAAEVGAGLSFNAALQKMPIADASAVLQFIPLVTTVAAALLFAERVGWQRWLAAFAGLVGVLLILRPGTQGFTWWSLLAVAAMLCMSTRDLATSRVDPSIPTFPIGALTAAVAAVSGLALWPMAPWHAPSPAALALVAAAGSLMAAGFVCLVVAMRNADMSALAPFRYCTILWAILLGVLVWGEVPDWVAVAGIVLVVAAGLATLMRERRLARRLREVS